MKTTKSGGELDDQWLKRLIFSSCLYHVSREGFVFRCCFCCVLFSSLFLLQRCVPFSRLFFPVVLLPFSLLVSPSSSHHTLLVAPSSSLLFFSFSRVFLGLADRSFHDRPLSHFFFFSSFVLTVVFFSFLFGCCFCSWVDNRHHHHLHRHYHRK